MYLTQTDLIKWQLEEAANTQISDIIQDLIKADMLSPEKKAMCDGNKYYIGEHDILQVDFQKFFVDGVSQTNKNAANNRIVNAYHRVLVDQKAGYISGNNITFSGDEQFINFMNNTLGKQRHKYFRSLITGASNKGAEYLHVFINAYGNFDYVIIPATQIIPVYDSSYQKELTSIIRYYPFIYKASKMSPPQTLYKVEIWDKEKTYFFTETPSGGFIPDGDKTVNPRYHFYEYNTIEPNNRSGKGWGRVPFIELRNNDEKKSDLTFTKSLIDNYDYDLSKMGNNLADIAKAIWVLRGYEGTDLAEFMTNLNLYNALKVGETGGAEPKQLDIPDTAHDGHMERLEDNIFVFGMGVNPKTKDMTISPSGIALKFMYAGLDIKSNILITEMSYALAELAWFVSEFSRIKTGSVFDISNFEPIFNKSVIFNETEIIDSAQKSKGIISDETILEHHPWVSDVQKELQRLEEQEANSPKLDLLSDTNIDNSGAM